MELAEALASLAKDHVRREVAPGVHAFLERRPMHRVRSYTSAALGPFADRNVQEMLLLGHVHVQDGKVLRIEGFNGQDGARWAQAAEAKLKAQGLLPADATVRVETPLKACPHAMR